MDKTFDPKEHMRVFERRQRQPDGSYKTVRVDYLDVRWRIVWFRLDHPNGTIETELLTEPGSDPAVVKATVSYYDEAGTETVATGHGQQGKDDWSDYLEKAETRAIGRALGLLGYGTQFASDEFDEVIADAPSERRAAAPRQSAPRQSAPRQGAPKARSGGGESGEMMTPNQQKYLFSLAREAGVPNEELAEIVHERFGHGVDMLLKSEASALIGSLQELRDDRQLSEAADRPFDSGAGSGSAPAPTNSDGWDFKDNTAGMAPDGITEKQVEAIERLRTKQNMGDKDLIGYAAGIAGRDLDSIVELSESEAGALITALGSL